MTSAVCLVLILLALVLIPCVGVWLRKRDFNRQLRGERPERPAGRAAAPKPDQPDMSEAQRMADEARLKSRQNVWTL